MDIYGWMPNSLLPILIKVTGIKPEEVNVILHGRVDAKILKQALCKRIFMFTLHTLKIVVMLLQKRCFWGYL